ncbi:MAG: hypothetical protein WC277_05430 [Bacilli bacterium]
METHTLKLARQREIHTAILELAGTDCEISCYECPFVVPPHGTTCVKQMIKDLLYLNEQCKVKRSSDGITRKGPEGNDSVCTHPCKQNLAGGVPPHLPRPDPRLYALKPEFDRVLKDLETPDARARAEALHRRLSRVNPEDGFRPFDI